LIRALSGTIKKGQEKIPEPKKTYFVGGCYKSALAREKEGGKSYPGRIIVDFKRKILEVKGR